MKVLHALTAAALTAGLLGGCATADTSHDRDNASKHGKSTKTKGGSGSDSGPDNSTKTQDGPVSWGNWEVVGPISPKPEFGDYALTMRVKNTGDAPDSGFFTVTILKGQNILGTLDCSTSEVKGGQVATADCMSTDKYATGWSEITVENAF